jgi:hypothetical protein
MRQMIFKARLQFDSAVEAVLEEAQAYADSLRPAIGEVSADQALLAWKREMVARLQR